MIVMTSFIEEHIVLVSVLMIAVCIFVTCYDRVRYHFAKPKYKTDSEGFLMYKDPWTNYWWYVTRWDENDSERTVTIHDTIRGIVFDYHYKGPGRYKVKVPENCFGQMKYKNTRELHKEQTELINREDELLKKILKNKI